MPDAAPPRRIRAAALLVHDRPRVVGANEKGIRVASLAGSTAANPPDENGRERTRTDAV
jgi:hypothetical protein